eukprot:CAMPEP_0181337648 /NCGR_PEP_ID=MMETSP1101-20121128/28146_1 /TAXON_ID=46948 /ORGANISM="Rhodomonas abbreviata, Strain Caron Lab Isolate" /LENGTH=440 /DNA_ID=CAMNT_0023448187 /DNA_START=149 /DNA_END=1471 /DNA_ORIENTATION=-
MGVTFSHWQHHSKHTEGSACPKTACPVEAHHSTQESLDLRHLVGLLALRACAQQVPPPSITIDEFLEDPQQIMGWGNILPEDLKRNQTVAKIAARHIFRHFGIPENGFITIDQFREWHSSIPPEGRDNPAGWMLTICTRPVKENSRLNMLLSTHKEAILNMPALIITQMHIQATHRQGAPMVLMAPFRRGSRSNETHKGGEERTQDSKASSPVPEGEAEGQAEGGGPFFHPDYLHQHPAHHPSSSLAPNPPPPAPAVAEHSLFASTPHNSLLTNPRSNPPPSDNLSGHKFPHGPHSPPSAGPGFTVTGLRLSRSSSAYSQRAMPSEAANGKRRSGSFTVTSSSCSASGGPGTGIRDSLIQVAEDSERRIRATGLRPLPPRLALLDQVGSGPKARVPVYWASQSASAPSSFSCKHPSRTQAGREIQVALGVGEQTGECLAY